MQGYIQSPRRLRSPVRWAFLYGIRHFFIIIQWTVTYSSENHDEKAWKYAVSYMKMPVVQEFATSLYLLLMTIYIYKKKTLKFPILTKILILKSIIGNKIDQLLFYKSYGRSMERNNLTCFPETLWAIKTLTCIHKLYFWCFSFKWMFFSRPVSYVCIMFSDVGLSFSLIILLCGSIIELATIQCYCAQNILGIGLFTYSQLGYILIFEYALLHFLFSFFFRYFSLFFFNDFFRYLRNVIGPLYPLPPKRN